MFPPVMIATGARGEQAVQLCHVMIRSASVGYVLSAHRIWPCTLRSGEVLSATYAPTGFTAPIPDIAGVLMRLNPRSGLE